MRIHRLTPKRIALILAMASPMLSLYIWPTDRLSEQIARAAISMVTLVVIDLLWKEEKQ